MAIYEMPSDEITKESLEELDFILNWARVREKTRNDPPIVLIGGCAVDAYNSWYGSIDIDLIANSRMKNKLKFILKTERGYESHQIYEKFNTVMKPTASGDIIIDFISREGMQFEGREEFLDFDISQGQTTIKEIRGGISALVPTRGMLLLLKLKAAWDRSYRIRNETAEDIEWERGKLVKDYADIIALIDPAHGGTEIEIGLLGENLGKFSFLKRCFENVPDNLDAIEKYGGMAQDDVRDTIELLLSLV